MAKQQAWEKLDQLARKLPQVATGTSCNKTSYKVQGKSFLFVGVKEATYEVMVKLKDSLPLAEQLAAEEAGWYHVGSNGWVTAKLPHGEGPPRGIWQQWVEESFYLQAPKKLLAELGEGASAAKSTNPTKARTKATKKKAKKKSATKTTKASQKVSSKRVSPAQADGRTKKGGNKKATVKKATRGKRKST